MVTIAVLIAAHNRKMSTMQCLKHLNDQTNNASFKIKVFLVDDASEDGTSEMILKTYPEITVISGDGSLFWNRGMIKAWKSAKEIQPEFFLWLNDDSFLFPDAISQALTIHKSVNQDCVIVGSMSSAVNRDVTTYGGRNNEEVIPINGRLQRCNLFNGNFVLIPFRVYSKVGMLDSRFRHSFGDIEYGLRLGRIGVPIFILPNHVGTCERNAGLPICFRSGINIVYKFKHLYSPLGMNPFEFFYLRKKYNGIVSACITFLSLHIRVIFPKFWL